MARWNDEDLGALDRARELEITSLDEDGTPRSYRTIWGVRVGDDYYVRSVNGTSGVWYQGAHTLNEGRIQALDNEIDVSFVDVDENDDVQSRIDEAYQEKYDYSPDSLRMIISSTARPATLKVVPR